MKTDITINNVHVDLGTVGLETKLEVLHSLVNSSQSWVWNRPAIRISSSSTEESWSNNNYPTVWMRIREEGKGKGRERETDEGDRTIGTLLPS